MQHRIIQPTEALRPYIYRYVYVRADGSTDTMTPPADDPHFVAGKHVQQLLPNYGSFIFMRNVAVEVCGMPADQLLLLGANQRTITLTTMSGWFEGMLLDFKPGGMHALLGVDLQLLRGRVLTAESYGERGLTTLDSLYKQADDVEECSRLIDAFFLGHLPQTEDRNYMRLRRFHRALQAMQEQAANGREVDLMSIALDHGYYDLSHMALEFQQMGCVSPSHFRMLGIPLTADFSVFFA